jgi:hypothetical protein
MIVLWALTSVMFLAVGTMAIVQVRLILKGESEVEGHDNGKLTQSSLQFGTFY